MLTVPVVWLSFQFPGPLPDPSEWYNKRNDRWGKLFGGRFDSVLLDEQGAVARVMAYITLNAVRARLVDDPAEYRWCGYAERLANGKLRKNDWDFAVYMPRELGMSDGMLRGTDGAVMGRVWKRFRKGLLGSRVERGNFNSETIAELLNASNKPLEPATTAESEVRDEGRGTMITGVCDRRA
jgi:hypothetical protein